MQMIIELAGGAKVDASFHGFTVRTDQPPAGGGEGSAPTPFQLFLSTIGTCAGVYVNGFCRQRGIPTDGIRLVQTVTTDPENGRVTDIDVRIELPDGFPEKYVDAVVRAADQCAVKKALEHPPVIRVESVIGA